MRIVMARVSDILRCLADAFITEQSFKKGHKTENKMIPLEYSITLLYFQLITLK